MKWFTAWVVLTLVLFAHGWPLGLMSIAGFIVFAALAGLWNSLTAPTPTEKDIRYIADEIRVTRGEMPLRGRW